WALLGWFTLAVLTLAALGLLLGCTAGSRTHAKLASHLPHHLASLEEAFNKFVHFGHGHTGTVGDALAPRSVEDLWIIALGRGHTADNRLDAVELLLINHVRHLGHLLATRQHLEDVADWSHAADHQHLVKEVFQGELAGAQLLGSDLCLFLIHDCFGVLDE